MNKKKSYYLDSDYVLMIVLLLFSGDPFTRLLGRFAILFASVLIFVIMYPKIKKDFYFVFLGITSGLLLLFVWQYAILGFVSWLGAFNFINTFFLGALIIYLIGERFPYKFFILVSYSSIISLIFFIPINLLSIHVPGLAWGEGRLTYIVYTYVENHHFRNCGFFWEPGAFAAVLTLCMALNVKDLPNLWKGHKMKIIAIILALIITQSTTGYVGLFVIGCYFMLFFLRDKSMAFTLLPLTFIIGIIVYTNAAFLKDKVESQSEESMALGEGEFSNTRFGSFLFDMYYIKKHPIIGNGFNEITRYADHPDLVRHIQAGGTTGEANGLSNFIACLGVPFMFFYLLLSFKAASNFDRKVGILVFLVITLSLVSEQWLNYPLFLGAMFFNNKKKLMNE